MNVRPDPTTMVSVPITCLFFYEAMIGLAAPGTLAIAQTIAGPSAAARWVGVRT